jgi:hypothetical protein
MKGGIDKKILMETSYDDLVKVFPKELYGLSRRELVEMKKRVRAGLNDSESLKADRENRKGKANIKLLQRKYDDALKAIEALEQERDQVVQIQNTVSTFKIQPHKGSKNTEATAVWVASDWHIEERVDPKKINNLSEYTLDIARQRSQDFFRYGLRLTEILDKDVEIKTIVLALLGDFITNRELHPELSELCVLEPMHAIIEAQNLLASGIQFVLDNSKYNLVIVCHSGNHARTTDTTRFATEAGHSLEYMMYHFLADHFRSEPRIKFIIPESYHSYIDVYDKVIRFHHGHALRYGGGIGGIYIPVNKALNQWNKARRADIDVFGHWHQQRDGGNFICNGSMIGYNAYAVSIKADFETPKQTLFLVDQKRGKTCVWPVMF